MSSQVATIRICDWILVVVLVGLLNDVLLECKLFYSYRCVQHRLLDRCNVKMNNNAVYSIMHA